MNMNLPSCILIGLIATVIMDIWGFVRRPLFGLPAADYRLVGRWVSHFARGQFTHAAIAQAPPMPGEQITGWLAHYLLGLGFAAALLTLVGEEWRVAPTLAPALCFGLATVMLPFGVMQPAMGLGVAASRTPRPAAARIQSLITHAIFGLGLYLGGWAAQLLFTTGD